jgi:hypothetical protein
LTIARHATLAVLAALAVARLGRVAIAHFPQGPPQVAWTEEGLYED